MPNRESILRRALEATNVATLHTALEENPDPYFHEQVLACASARGNTFIVRCLLDLDVDLDTRADDEPPLYLATLNGHRDVVEALLEHRADPNTIGWPRIRYRPSPGSAYVDDNVLGPDTVASIAIHEGHVHILELLLRYDADVYALTDRNETFLDAALAYKDADVSKAMVALLLERGIDFDVQDEPMPALDDRYYGREMVDMRRIRADVLKMVEMARHCQSLSYLCTLSDDEIHTPTRFGQTALHRAAENGQLEQVHYLVERRCANPFLRDAFGRRPHESAECRWDAFVEKSTHPLEDGVDFYTHEVYEIMRAKRDRLRTCASIIRKCLKDRVAEYNMYKMMAHAHRHNMAVHPGMGFEAILLLPPSVFELIRSYGVGWVPKSEQLCE